MCLFSHYGKISPGVVSVPVRGMGCVVAVGLLGYALGKLPSP